MLIRNTMSLKICFFSVLSFYLRLFPLDKNCPQTGTQTIGGRLCSGAITNNNKCFARSLACSLAYVVLTARQSYDFPSHHSSHYPARQPGVTATHSYCCCFCIIHVRSASGV